MLNYMHHFFKIRLVFHTLYLWSEIGDPHFFFAFLTQVDHYLTAVKVKKIHRPENFRANFLKFRHYCLLTNNVSIVDISFFSWISYTGGKNGKSKRWTDKWTALWVREEAEGVIWQTPRCLWSTKRHWAYNSVAWIVNYRTLERKTVLSVNLSQLFYESGPQPFLRKQPTVMEWGTRWNWKVKPLLKALPKSKFVEIFQCLSLAWSVNWRYAQPGLKYPAELKSGWNWQFCSKEPT